jgi:hypothetical protein
MATETAERNGNTAASNNSKSASIKQPRQRSLPSLQAVTGTSNMSEAAFVGRVDKNATEWQLLPLYAAFSTAEDGSHPMVKVSRSKAVSLVDGKSQAVGSGRCYRVILSNR